MTSVAYLADLAQLGVSLRIVDDGLSLHVYGFNEKLKDLALQLAKGLATLSEWKELKSRLKVAKEILQRGYRNKFLKPSRQSKHMRLRMLLDRGVYSPSERLSALERCDVEMIQSHCRSIFGERADRGCFMEVFCLGNLTKKDSIGICCEVAEILKLCPLEKNESSKYGRTNSKCIVLPVEHTIRSSSMCSNPDEGNSVCEIYFQLSPCSDFTESCMVDILSQIIDEPYYDILRTKQQLGYYVDASSRMTASVLGFCFIVKGDAVRAEEAECRVMEFLSEFHHTLKTMPRNKFASHRRAVSQEKLEPDDSMGDEARRFYGEITSARFDFHSWEKEASRVMEISQKDFTKWFHSRFCDVKTSRRLVVHIRSSKEPKGYRGTKRYENVKYRCDDETTLSVLIGELEEEKGDDTMSVEELHSSLKFHKDSLSIIKDSRQVSVGGSSSAGLQ